MENELLKRIEELEKSVNLLTKIIEKQYGLNKNVLNILGTLIGKKLYNEEDLKW